MPGGEIVAAIDLDLVLLEAEGVRDNARLCPLASLAWVCLVLKTTESPI